MDQIPRGSWGSVLATGSIDIPERIRISLLAQWFEIIKTNMVANAKVSELSCATSKDAKALLASLVPIFERCKKLFWKNVSFSIEGQEELNPILFCLEKLDDMETSKCTENESLTKQINEVGHEIVQQLCKIVSPDHRSNLSWKQQSTQENSKCKETSTECKDFNAQKSSRHFSDGLSIEAIGHRLVPGWALKLLSKFVVRARAFSWIAAQPKSSRVDLLEQILQDAIDDMGKCKPDFCKIAKIPDNLCEISCHCTIHEGKHN